MSDYLKQQIEARQSAWHAAKSLLDAAAAEKRDLSAEEEQSYQRMMADIDSRSDRISDLQKAEERALQIESAMVSAPEVRATAPRTEERVSDGDILRKMAMGEIRSHTFEFRNLNKSDDSTAIPTGFVPEVIRNLQYTGPWPTQGMYNVLQTQSGETIKVPTETGRPTGTATAEAATFAISDPTFSEISLGAFKYGTLVVASREFVTDAGFDLEAFLGRQIGVSLGTAVNSALTVGTGSVQPNGILNGAGSATTGGTGVSGVPTADNLIDLVHAVDTLYASSPAAAFQMARATLGSVRKLKDTAGNYIYYPAASVGSPDTLLGYRIVENPYISATGTGNKSVIFGDMSQFWVRQVGGIEVVRSDEAYFTSDQIAWRATIRIDSALGNSSAVKYYTGGAS